MSEFPSFLRLNNVLLSLCIYHILFFQSSVYRHFGCFCVLAFVNNAAVNMGIQIAIWVPAFCSLEIYLEVELLDYVVNLSLIF